MAKRRSMPEHSTTGVLEMSQEKTGKVFTLPVRAAKKPFPLAA
jgi:hypothetical protein